MNSAIDRLADFLVSIIDLCKVGVIVDQYERGVILRWGKLQRLLLPGFHWHWPLGVDQVLTDNVVPTTDSLDPQSLTTKDGLSIVLSGIVTWQIDDIEKVLLQVEDADGVLTDTACGVIARAVAQSTWQQITDPTFPDRLTRRVQTLAAKYGIGVLRVQISDLSRSRSLRLWQSE